MRYLSVCSGIEAATVAWHDLGWQPAAFSEIEPFPSAVLAHHYPNVPNLGDMTKFKEWDIGTIDLLVGGTPCQSFSVAGLRKGLEDPRGNLALTYVGILDKFRPKWFVWENVPGVLSSGSGRDFGSFLGAVEQIGYGFAYRVLDAQYFGVAQRRKRVFVVGCLGDWRSAAAVLFESHSLSGNPAPSREKGQKVAGTIAARFGISRNNHEECVAHVAPTVTGGAPFSRTGNERVECDAMIPVADPAYCLETTCNDYSRSDGFNMISTYGIPGNWIGRKPENGGNAVEPMHDVAPCLTKTDRHGVAQPIPFGVNERPDVGHCLRSGASRADKHESTTYIAQPIAFHVNAMPDQMNFNVETAASLTCSQHAGVAIPIGTDCYNGSITGDIACTMGTPGSSVNASGPTVMQNMAVRRLTPTECERLQGFPDGYTNIPWRKKDESPDGPRYKSLGNSMAVPVMAWIGKRIANAP